MRIYNSKQNLLLLTIQDHARLKPRLLTTKMVVVVLNTCQPNLANMTLQSNSPMNISLVIFP